MDNYKYKKGIWFHFYIYVRPILGIIFDIGYLSDLYHGMEWLIIIAVLYHGMHIIQMYKTYNRQNDAYRFFLITLATDCAFILFNGWGSIEGIIISLLLTPAWAYGNYIYFTNRKCYLEPMKLYICDYCEKQVDENNVYCPHCGNEFENDDSADVKGDAIIDKYEQLKKIKELLDDKIITKDEFEKEKKKILNK